MSTRSAVSESPEVLGEPRISLVPSFPLLQQHMSVLRDTASGIINRRASLKFVAREAILHAARNIKTSPRKITTPLGKYDGVQISEVITVVEIWRAGKWMTDPALELFPSARVSCIGTRRNEASAKAENYYYNFTPSIKEGLALVNDVMLATGGSMIDGLRRAAEAGAKNMKAVCILAAPEGVCAVNQAFPDVEIIGVELDRCLNDNKYILPGLGDAGDLLSGNI